MKINIKECYRDYNTCRFSEQEIVLFDTRTDAINYLSQGAKLSVLELGESWARFRKPFARLEVEASSEKYVLISRREGDIDAVKGLVAYKL